MAGLRPRFPWAKAAAPSFLYAARMRRTCRIDRSSSSAASLAVVCPPITRFSTSNRFCSLSFNVTVSTMGDIFPEQ